MISKRIAILAAAATCALALLVLAGCQTAAPPPPPPAPVAPAPAPPPDPCAGTAVLTEATCAGDELSGEERKLVALINGYRAENGLLAVAVSPALLRVANRHARDLEQNVGRLSQSWSDCPYQSGQPQTYLCMWHAPRRLGTGYPGEGYEHAHSYSTGATAESAFAGWKNGQSGKDMLLSRGSFQGYGWQAIGVAIRGTYALLWMGREPDPAAR